MTSNNTDSRANAGTECDAVHDQLSPVERAAGLPFRRMTPLTLAEPTQIRARAQTSGYLWLCGILDTEVVLAARSLVVDKVGELGWLDPAAVPMSGRSRPGAGYHSGVSWEDPDWLALQIAVLSDARVSELHQQTGLLEAMQVIFGEPVGKTQGSVCRVSFPNQPVQSTQPHHDYAYLGGTDRAWIAWIPLGDCSIDVGPIAVLDGSRHKSWDHGTDPSRPGLDLPADTIWTTADLRCGDAVLINVKVVHRAMNNVSDVLRLSVDFRCYPASES